MNAAPPATQQDQAADARDRRPFAQQGPERGAPPPAAGRRMREASIGERVSARKAEKATAAAIAAASSTNSRPT
ncbi:hypothetical protein GMDG_08763 [Pseudogymnoascus destructans 20631-21]|uniref:Uncharacterized protein n=1 Tax=Pseudogymnoascus destructans (strain ATCC MYA-4855 / 20631-21) TaxID=658429 RepID=L8GC25_PSED2|nr:hypothetical protein GMDG_08763 [Pseudogymnoascus destructans 20631-21]